MTVVYSEKGADGMKIVVDLTPHVDRVPCATRFVDRIDALLRSTLDLYWLRAIDDVY